MNREQVKGKWEQTKGKVKEEVGHITGNLETENEGLKERVKGKFRESYGDVKDKVKQKLNEWVDDEPEDDSKRGPW